MSAIQVKYPPRDMTPLIEHRALPDVPQRARWWRLRVLPDQDGVAYNTSIDGLDALNGDADATVTYSWSDGIDESGEAFAARMVTEPDDPPYLGLDCTSAAMSRATVWADALSLEAPTSNPRWSAITLRGNHRHPEDLEAIERLRAERGLVPIWAVPSVLVGEEGQPK